MLARPWDASDDAPIAELLQTAGHRVERAGAPSLPDLHDWLRDWDRRHVALEGRCSSELERERWSLLGRLRHRLQGTLERFEREEGVLARAMNRASMT